MRSGSCRWYCNRARFRGAIQGKVFTQPSGYFLTEIIALVAFTMLLLSVRPGKDLRRRSAILPSAVAGNIYHGREYPAKALGSGFGSGDARAFFQSAAYSQLHDSPADGKIVLWPCMTSDPNRRGMRQALWVTASCCACLIFRGLSRQTYRHTTARIFFSTSLLTTAPCNAAAGVSS